MVCWSIENMAGICNRAANVFGLCWTLTCDAALGGDDEVGGVRVERFANEAFGDFWTVGVGCVDECNAEFNGASEDAARFAGILRFAPGAIPYEAHSAIAKPGGREVAADSKDAAG